MLGRGTVQGGQCGRSWEGKIGGWIVTRFLGGRYLNEREEDIEYFEVF